MYHSILSTLSFKIIMTFNYSVTGGKNKNKCFADWFSQNPSPGHLFLISGDKDINFSCILLRNFHRRNDNILLACPGKAEGCVSIRAFIVWQWSSVLKGKYLTGRYFCYPPEWYAKARAPLEYPPEWYRNWKVHPKNPFLAAEEPTSSQNAEIHIPSSFFGEDQNVCYRPVREVLSSYPNGIPVGELKMRLGIPGDTKMFSQVIASIPQVQFCI